MKKIYKERWISGYPETLCGAGSTIKSCEPIIKTLPIIIKEFKIKSILDLGCGDLNWIKHVREIEKVKYLGIDTHIHLESIHTTNDFKLIEGNILYMEIPKSDLVICKDVMIHMENFQIKSLLESIKQSKSKYILLTNYSINNNKRSLKNYAPLNIELPPFSLKNYIMSITLEGNKSLTLFENE